MKDKIVEQFRTTIKDRQLVGLLVSICIASAALMMYVVTSLHYRDTPIVTHYTSYGTQHLYDSSWFEILSFVGFALIVMLGHLVLTIKLSASKNRNTAFVFGFATLMVLFVAFIVAHQVLRVAVL